MTNEHKARQINVKKMREELESRILQVIDEVDTGFKQVMKMYTIAFYAGLVIVMFSFIGTITLQDNMFTLIFGGVGILDVVAFLIFKPAEDLQRSRGNLAQLVSAFLTWYNDTHNWNQFLAKELVKDRPAFKVFNEVSTQNIVNTLTIMCAIELFVASKLSGDVHEKLQAIIKDIKGEAGHTSQVKP